MMKRFTPILGLTVGTVLVGTAFPRSASAQTAREVARVAIPTTVQINNLLAPNSGGSGVIIAKDDETYTVLTANHVVANPNSEYEIVTSRENSHTVTNVINLDFDPEPERGIDLAIVQFESDEDYPIAPVTDSEEATVGSGIYISGYPLPGTPGEEREYSFTNGIISNVRSSDEEGYLLRYDAVTRRGMSGGPVFDVSGRVVGIHGQGETTGVTEVVTREGTQGQEEAKTGFNFAIPANTFMELAEDVDGFSDRDMAIDDDPPAEVDSEEVESSDVDDWFEAFAFELLEDVLRDVLRRFLPF